ncbi:hypothetical protein [Flagellimonas aurea]|uniref:hypothetical protein n=1 Tax=Flagellimonas aurea TaxID=2915619 RepID=UPI0035CF604D
MKNIILVTLLFSLSMGLAQENKEEVYEALLQEQVETLQLSGQKKEDFLSISHKYNEKIKDIGNSEGSKFSKFKALKSLQKEKNDELESLLSKEEFKLFKELQKENRKMLKDGHKQKGGR